MGYRGSKSVLTYTVKEQRVDGSYFIKPKFMKLRCTLMGFERYCQISNPSKQNFKKNFKLLTPCLNRSFYSQTKNLITYSNLNKQISTKVNFTSQLLNPWFITGFTDAEGCFGLYIYKNAALKIGWYTFLEFKITLHVKDKKLLENIKIYFGVGVISKHGENLCNYSIKSIKDIQKVINHFDKFPLKTKKIKDYKNFKKAYYIIINKEHLTKQGLDLLVSIKSSMNLGLSPELNLAFQDINLYSVINEPYNISATAPFTSSLSIIEEFDPNWVSGFASGDGSFQVEIRKIKIDKYQVLLKFSIGQHSRDELLLKSLAVYLDCGKVKKK